MIKSLYVVFSVKIEARTYRTVAERVGGKAVGSTAPVAWRIRTGGLWKSNIKDKLILAADFDEGFLTAVREGDWENTKAARRVRGVQSAVDDVGDEAGADRLQRVLCASVFEATLSGGRITIPREIVWLVQRDNDEHRA